jgi:hypothetical protein
VLQGQAHIVDLRRTDSVQTIRFDPPGSHQHNISGLAFSPQVWELVDTSVTRCLRIRW